MGSKLGLVVGFTSGLAVGWLLGIFSAPKSGRETFDELGGMAIELKGKAGEAAEWVKDEVLHPRSSPIELGAEETL
jgi:hypothetical protein